MFEALFILTTIDAGTRIARFLLQETAGQASTRRSRRPDWLPGAILATRRRHRRAGAGSSTPAAIDTIWPMFGIANQLLAVLALALVTTWLVNNGRGRYAWVTILPMLFVCSTTLTAGVKLVTGRFPEMIDNGREKVAEGATAAGEKMILTGYLNSILTIFVITCVCTLLFWSAARWLTVWFGWGAPPAGLATGATKAGGA